MFHPSKIVGIGVNYRAHAVEMGKGLPEEPLMFLKPPSALLADGQAIERPGGYERVDYEGELGVVIGKRARRVSRGARSTSSPASRASTTSPSAICRRRTASGRARRASTRSARRGRGSCPGSTRQISGSPRA
jgi:hypothetical protein